MTVYLTIACLFCAFLFLGILTLIDLKLRLLPNKQVAGFLTTGIVFHTVTNFHFIAPHDMLIGLLAGASLLLLVRYVANKKYKQDTLGLGDVKLIGAAGVWLGLDHIFLAISIGAFAGLVHGLVYAYYLHKKTGKAVSLSTFSIPAGPGFIVGIIVTGLIKFHELPKFLLDFL